MLPACLAHQQLKTQRLSNGNSPYKGDDTIADDGLLPLWLVLGSLLLVLPLLLLPCKGCSLKFLMVDLRGAKEFCVFESQFKQAETIKANTDHQQRKTARSHVLTCVVPSLVAAGFSRCCRRVTALAPVGHAKGGGAHYACCVQCLNQ